MELQRRKFIKNLGAMAILWPFAPPLMSSIKENHSSDSLEVHLFSKHLQFLDPGEAGQIAAELGFDGLDLTVRPHGHVLPEIVKSELPKALKDIQLTGSSCKMITTAISDVRNPIDIDVIETAGLEGIRYYRSDWFKYSDAQSMEASLKFYQEKIKHLSQFNKINNIIGCYQNHSGTKVGASLWEVNYLLKLADHDFFGAQYDIRHAVAEGGKSWPNGIRLLKDQIKTIVLKDFKWNKVNGKWRIVNVPIGEGMVDFKKYFKLLKSYGLNPPASLHLEYPLGGAEKGMHKITIDKKKVFEAMLKDLTKVKLLWAQS